MEDQINQVRQLANRLECATSTGERVETLQELQVNYKYELIYQTTLKNQYFSFILDLSTPGSFRSRKSLSAVID